MIEDGDWGLVKDVGSITKNISLSNIKVLYLGRPTSLVFNSIKNLRHLTIGIYVPSINNDMFSDCSSLTSVDISNSVTSIGESAFQSCSSLTSVDIPNSVTSIGESAFYNCVKLLKVDIEDGTKPIDLGRFAFCQSRLETFKTGRNVYGGGNDFFSPHLNKVILGSNVTEISDYLFMNCKNIKEVYSLNTTPPVIGENTFENWTCLSSTLYIPKGCKTIYWLHPYWEKFFHMEEFEPTEVEPIMTNEKKVITDSTVYNLNGQRMRVKSDNINYLPNGIYIVNGKKVILK